MIIIWLIIGIAIVTVSFFTASNDNLWASIDTAGIAATLYLITLIAYTMRKPFPILTRITTWILFVAFGMRTFFVWTGTKSQTYKQTNMLLTKRGLISHRMMLDETEQILFNTLKKYHRQSAGDKIAIGQMFHQLHPSDKVGNNIHTPFSGRDSLMIFLAELSDTAVTLIAQENSVKGQKHDFKNFNGGIGTVQLRATLTEKGVIYESEN